jgi:hypothetical protein
VLPTRTFGVIGSSSLEILVSLPNKPGSINSCAGQDWGTIRLHEAPMTHQGHPKSGSGPGIRRYVRRRRLFSSSFGCVARVWAFVPCDLPSYLPPRHPRGLFNAQPNRHPSDPTTNSMRPAPTPAPYELGAKEVPVKVHCVTKCLAPSIIAIFFPHTPASTSRNAQTPAGLQSIEILGAGIKE